MNGGVSCSEINGQDGLEMRVGIIYVPFCISHSTEHILITKPHPPHDELYEDAVW